jgi:hypothetical protein
VIVEWPFFASFPAPLGINRLYLAESTAFVIEVKSNLSSQWGEVESTARQLHPLRRLWKAHIALNPAGTDFDFRGPSEPSRIAFVAVGFSGYQTGEKLKLKLRGTPEEARPDAALVVESGAYASWRFDAEGELGLFAFCLDCSHLMREILFAEPNLVKCVSGRSSETPKEARVFGIRFELFNVSINDRERRVHVLATSSVVARPCTYRCHGKSPLI